MQLFFATKSDIDKKVLPPEESQHCVKVLRKKNGDEVNVIDGQGSNYRVRITDANHKSCGYEILSKKEVPYNLPDLHIAMAPTKNLDRFEFFIEKACELGIREITPILTYNSERKHLNVEKLRKKMIAACKQSYTLHFPQINEVTKFSDLIKAQCDQKLIGHCHSHSTPHLKTMTSNRATLLLVGPEGDFSPEEVSSAAAAGFSPISLGNKRLRTETAGLFACSIFNLAHE